MTRASNISCCFHCRSSQSQPKNREIVCFGNLASDCPALGICFRARQIFLSVWPKLQQSRSWMRQCRDRSAPSAWPVRRILGEKSADSIFYQYRVQGNGNHENTFHFGGNKTVPVWRGTAARACRNTQYPSGGK